MWKNLSTFFGLPESRLFWVFLFFLVAVLVLQVLYLPPSLLILGVGLLLILGAAVFWNTYAAAMGGFKMRVERNELASIMSNMGDAFIAYDKDFVILYFNPAAEKLFGLEAKHVIGREIKPKTAEDPRLYLLARVIFPSLAPAMSARSKSGEYPQVVDVSFEDPSLELRVVTSPITDEEGTLKGFMKIVRNRSREVALLRSKDEFIGVASHQLRTPAAEVNWGLEMLAQNKSLDAEGKALAEHIAASSKRLLDIIEALLDVSKIEQGRFGYNFVPTDPVNFLEKTLGDALIRAQKAGVKLYFDRPKDPLPQAMIDPQKLSTAVSNLVDNAIRYNIENGEVTVRLTKAEKGPYLEVSVKDTGIGIAPEELGKIFTKFFRAPNAVKFQTEGSGLGLYIAKNIVKAHGGEIWIESEPNRGTTVRFTVPTDPSLIPVKETAIEY